ncbi:N-acetylmuramoyl-L-alanine amidase [Leptolyngbya sp. FACHB-1515]
MKGLAWLAFGGMTVIGTPAAIAQTEQPLGVVYPPDGHETTAAQIFLIGTAAPTGEVTVNGQQIDRSPAGHFAPSFPLALGENTFTLQHGSETVVIRVIRNPSEPPAPVGVSFGEGSLSPAVDIARMPGETVCFGAIAPPNATVSVQIAGAQIPLLPQSGAIDLPPNSAVLTSQNQPISLTAQQYRGCAPLNAPSGALFYGNNLAAIAPATSGDLGQPEFQLRLNGETVTQTGTGRVELLSPVNPPVIEVTAASGTARSGASTDFSRLTPLPQGTRASVTGREGEWLRLDYGAWIRASETRTVESAALPRSIIRSVTTRQANGWTEVVFPLQVPVPVSVTQGDRTFTLTLHNTIAQTDTIRADADVVIDRLDWQQIAPDRVQYTFNLKSAQQWGYKLRYEGTSLILSLRHPPQPGTRQQPLAGMRILLDPGHGGPEDFGARGPTGYPEKAQTLAIANLIRPRLEALGATVLMTREDDADLLPQDRVNLINELEPTIALSLHYNALPDEGNAEDTAGISTFWYNAQAHDLAQVIHDQLVQRLDRPSYGVYWNNLALTRPTVAPSVLLEFGFMINPEEFEWIVDPQQQERLADALAQSLVDWRRSIE